MSESDTIFNEQDRRYAAVQFILSTNPSHDNRTIASTLKMLIQTVQRAQGDENKVSSYHYGLWCGFKWGPHHATSHLRSQLESQHLDVLKSVVIPSCPQVVGGRPWVRQQDPALAHKSKETQAWLQKECYDFVPFSQWPPSSPDLNPLDYLFGHTSRTSPIWPPTTPKPAWLPPCAEYLPNSCQHLWKRHAPSSRFVSRRWLRLKAATLNRRQLYYIIKLLGLIFSIKVLK